MCDCSIRVYCYKIQAVFDVDPNNGLTLVEMAEGVSEDDVGKATGCSYKVCVIISTYINSCNIIFF